MFNKINIFKVDMTGLIKEFIDYYKQYNFELILKSLSQLYFLK